MTPGERPEGGVKDREAGRRIIGEGSGGLLVDAAVEVVVREVDTDGFSLGNKNDLTNDLLSKSSAEGRDLWSLCIVSRNTRFSSVEYLDGKVGFDPRQTRRLRD